ncbi:restriction endonuclease subunit S [Geitlerinema splendidum]|nr:restriction endonuclease subunit S [Geitlerinema splendidum]
MASLEYFTIEELLQKKAILEMQDGNHGEQHPRQSDFVDKGIPFLTATHVFDNQVFLNLAPRISPDKSKKLRIGWIQPNDVLLSHNATVGRVGVVPQFEGKAVIGTSLTYYRLNPKWFSPDFFALVLSSQEFQSQLEQIMKQTTRNQVPITRQRELIVPVLPISEQKRIAAIAQKADRLRRTRRYALQLSDTYLQSVFLEMFGDPVTNPKGWKIVEIGDVCIKVTDGTHQPPTFTASGIPFIFVQNIAKGEIDFSNIRYVSEATYKELTRHTKSRKKRYNLQFCWCVLWGSSPSINRY